MYVLKILLAAVSTCISFRHPSDSLSRISSWCHSTQYYW